MNLWCWRSIEDDGGDAVGVASIQEATALAAVHAYEVLEINEASILEPNTRNMCRVDVPVHLELLQLVVGTKLSCPEVSACYVTTECCRDRENEEPARPPTPKYHGRQIESLEIFASYECPDKQEKRKNPEEEDQTNSNATESSPWKRQNTSQHREDERKRQLDGTCKDEVVVV